MYLLGPSLAAALLGTWRILARQGWAGEKSGLFEHPAPDTGDLRDKRDAQTVILSVASVPLIYPASRPGARSRWLS